MPGTGTSNRLVDILKRNQSKQVWNDATMDWMNDVYKKFVILLKRIESHNPNIDNFDYRWVENKVDEIEKGSYVTKKDLKKANLIWRKWK